MSSRRREFKFIVPTDEPYREKVKSELIDKWAKPVMEEIDRYFTNNPNARTVKINKFPSELETKEISYKIKDKEIRRTVKVPQMALPLLAGVFRSNAELKAKYKLQMSQDSNTINVYKAQPST
jgi:hypothetical protein